MERDARRARLDASFEAARRSRTSPDRAHSRSSASELLERGGELVDLSRAIFEGMPLWFGHQKTFVVTNQDHDQFRAIWKTDAGFKARNLILSEHAGTHVDAILEYDRDGPSIEQMPLEFFWGSAVCLDLSEVRFQDPDPEGTGWADTEVIQRAEARLEAAGEQIRPRRHRPVLVRLWRPDLSRSSATPTSTRA